MNSLVEMFSHVFMIRALITGIFISLSAALIGTPLVLRRNSMLGDSLSHVAFGAFAVASIFGFASLSIVIPIVILVSFFILRLDENSKIYGDSAIAVVSVGALAIGTFAVSLAGTNVDINNYLFGSILSISNIEVWLAIAVSFVAIIFCLIFHNKIFAITFDEKFARAIGINTKLYNALFAIFCSIVVVIGMRLIGALLISSILIFPTLSAKTMSKKFKNVVLISSILAVTNFIIGLIVAYLLSTPTGATIVIVNLLVLLLLKAHEKIT